MIAKTTKRILFVKEEIRFNFCRQFPLSISWGIGCNNCGGARRLLSEPLSNKLSALDMSKTFQRKNRDVHPVIQTISSTINRNRRRLVVKKSDDVFIREKKCGKGNILRTNHMYHVTPEKGGPLVYTRPSWAQKVIIRCETFTNCKKRLKPKTVSGIVMPTRTTNRPKAPSSITGYSTKNVNYLDNGHIFALQLGGPDLEANIVPQEQLWQQSGGWRDFEIFICNFALEQYVWDEPLPGDELIQAVKPAKLVHLEIDVLDLDEEGEPWNYTGTLTYPYKSTTKWDFIIQAGQDFDDIVWSPSKPSISTSGC